MFLHIMFESIYVMLRYVIHTRHLQILMTETFKALNQESPHLVWDIFQLKEVTYNLRQKPILKILPARTKTYGTNSLAFKASILWNSLPYKYKISQTSNILK